MGWGDGEGERRQTSFGLLAHSWEFTQATTSSPATTVFAGGCWDKGWETRVKTRSNTNQPSWNSFV